MIIDFYCVTFIIYACYSRAVSSKRKGGKEKRCSLFISACPPSRHSRASRARNGKKRKGSFCNNLQIHLDELILDVFWIVILWNCYENRQKIEINGFCSLALFFTAMQWSKLMRMNCMIALWAVKLINLWKSVLLVRDFERR